MSDTYSPEVRRGPGRPPKTEVSANPYNPLTGQLKRDGEGEGPKPREDRKEQVKARRRNRELLGPDRNLKLYVPPSAKDEAYVYRWVNDRPGRVQQLTVHDDWDKVSTTDMRGGDPDPGRNTAEGTVMTRTVDSGAGERAVLLRKPRDLYEEDKAEEQKALEARDEAMRQGQPTGSEGLSGPVAYVPNGRNTIDRR